MFTVSGISVGSRAPWGCWWLLAVALGRVSEEAQSYIQAQRFSLIDVSLPIFLTSGEIKWSPFSNTSPPSQIRIEVIFKPLKDELNCRINNFANFSLALRWPWRFRKGHLWLFGSFIGQWLHGECGSGCKKKNTQLKFIHISGTLQVVLQHIQDLEI